jgi:hypothetical protein
MPREREWHSMRRSTAIVTLGGSTLQIDEVGGDGRFCLHLPPWVQLRAAVAIEVMCGRSGDVVAFEDMRFYARIESNHDHGVDATFVEARLDAAGNPSMHLIVWLTGNVRMYAWRVLGRKFLLAMRAKNAFWWADAEAHGKRQKVLVSAMPQSEDAHNFFSLTEYNNTQEQHPRVCSHFP